MSRIKADSRSGWGRSHPDRSLDNRDGDWDLMDLMELAFCPSELVALAAGCLELDGLALGCSGWRPVDVELI
jgi:hypothetical protein